MLNRLQEEKLLPVTTDRQRINTIISQFSETKSKIDKDHKRYFDEIKNNRIVQQYYSNIDFENPNHHELSKSLTNHLKNTHKNQVRYDPSEYVYPWVDLRPDGNLRSIYSGKARRTEEVIIEDYKTSLRRKEEAESIQAIDNNQFKNKLAQIESDFKYNCEHVVPQSWFNEREPMRGDLHHLFTCDPQCNSIRSNYPYHDFADYNPENMHVNRIQEACGKANKALFEPEYGKGIAARAMLYFLVRYPDAIEQQHIKEVDKQLLLEWHHKFPPEIYEKHRNQAIYGIQENRNPFIDFPEKMANLISESCNKGE